MTDIATLASIGVAFATANGGAITFGLRQINKMAHKVRMLEKENEILRTQVSAIVRGNGLALSVWTKGVDRKLRWVSPRAQRIIFAPIGLSEPDILGKSFIELFGPVIGQQIEDLDRRAMAEIDSTQIDIIQLHPDLAPMVIIKTVTEDEDGKTVFQGIAIRLLDLEHRRSGENAQVLSRLVAADRASRRANARDELGLGIEELTARRSDTSASPPSPL